ncbi:MAG: hypothetical protein ACRDSZ_19905 [Pseudonocardiaceae bacterium]
MSWDRTSLSARIEAHPAGPPDDHLPEGLVLDKKHTRVVISWPGLRRPDQGEVSLSAIGADAIPQVASLGQESRPIHDELSLHDQDGTGVVSVVAGAVGAGGLDRVPNLSLNR